MSSNHYDVLVLGAGASGLMTAYMAAQRGRKVVVVEKANKVGKKILMSGGGKCNFTNLYVEPENFISHNPHFVISALTRYTNWDFIGMVCEYGIEYEERKHGQLFTLNGAKEILAMLLAECEKTGLVDIKTNCEVKAVNALESQGFQVATSLGYFEVESVVVASGGLSIPTLGGSGIGYDIAKQFGHHVYPTRAGLVPFMFSDSFKEVTTRLSGNAVEATLSNDLNSFTEALLFTHRGLSGPSSLQLSNYWDAGQSFKIDFLPSLDLLDFLKSKKQNQAKVLLRTLLVEHLPKSVVTELQNLIWLEQADTAIGNISDDKLEQIAQRLSAFEVKPSGTEGYRTAEVTLGGVDTTEVSSKTMESKKQKGLYFVGEILDVTGHLGGFNFQWAWSSAHAASEYV
ncbi:NAD(P)/FAD-dependent oxidoreductase [Acinetobacter cumulans]|uniref:NAD(P)/FAD-dependent oxidoreductase n=1 Tax=Acinetobacter cumulans TaxID=2136182 RepID=A0A3A8FUE4_9GAMM|nr:MULTISPECIES: NAD(P)/FAD-dependent oxidoreductase [Acinetobacter]QCO20126.1 aminoacetone oxidase family FAD-binding enzyme [Acinetobacter cumulans]RFS36221.1 NAD(P)/FAD-dependent oxidoreductase [Acinetobacter sp. SWAC5]RKG42594.1 NAD(P)/FAD-dependent oxidoreductase [Acinetobacter cumulans]RKG48771.1 NAD(P)/FAD-dependent oxidoreductase [Acinetobacter cumulans]RKG49829.1 NAD(P)/FAD-dependent oxidoreductase [Acinetobacter cumulans]